MKTISLLLVGMLCLSVMVYAGEVITNDTGQDATGLRVAFSTPVLITAFGDILTSVDPQMLAFEFVFSGGVVEPWGSHWFNYAPVSAVVTEYEWLTDLSPSCPDMWWEDDQIWAISQGLATKYVQLLANPSIQESIENDLNLFQAVGVDVASWNEIKWAPDWKEAFASFSDDIHSIGARVIGGFSMLGLGYEHPSLYFEDMSPAFLLDPFGNALRHEEYYPGAPVYSCLHPVYQRFILQILKDHIDCGADGIYIDELAYGSIFKPDFNPYTLSLFNEYLKTQYNVSVLRALAIREGFSSFDEFDYAAVVRNVLEDDFDIITLEDWGALGGRYDIPLRDDYWRFAHVENKRFAKWIVTEIKEYALETQDKCIPVSANINAFSSWQAFMIVDLLDYVDLEYPYFENGYPPSARGVPSLRTAQAYDKHGILITDMGTRPDLRERGPERSTTLIKTLIADAYAGDGAFYVEEGTHNLHFDMDALLPSWTFVESRPFLFESANRVPGSVAVVQLYESLHLHEGKDYRGLCHLLADSGFQFSTLVGSMDELALHPLRVSDLGRFEVVLVPELEWIEDEHASALLRYVEDGGQVIVFADRAALNSGGRSIAGQLFDLLKRGTTRVGEGTLVYEDSLIGSDYIADPSDEERNALLALLASLDVSPEIQFAAPHLVSAFAYDGTDSTVIHFVNYDYDPSLDQTQAFPSQAVSISAPQFSGMQSVTAIWYTPETDPIEIGVESDGSRATLRLPAIDVWGTLLLTTQMSDDYLRRIPASELHAGWVKEHAPMASALDEVIGSLSWTDIPRILSWPDTSGFVFGTWHPDTDTVTNTTAPDDRFNDTGWHFDGLRGTILEKGIVLCLEFAADDHPSTDPAVEYVIQIGQDAQRLYICPGLMTGEFEGVEIPPRYIDIGEFYMGVVIPFDLIPDALSRLETIAQRTVTVSVGYRGGFGSDSRMDAGVVFYSGMGVLKQWSAVLDEVSTFKKPEEEPDWASIPYTYSYRQTPSRPAKYSMNGTEMEPVLTNWGLAGSDVKGVKVSCQDEGLLIRWETRGASLPGEYSYILHLWRVPTHTLLAVSMSPITVSAAASLMEDGQWSEQEAYLVGLDASSITAWVPRSDVLCYGTSQSLRGWDLIPMLQFEEPGSLEFFEFPLRNELESK